MTLIYNDQKRARSRKMTVKTVNKKKTKKSNSKLKRVQRNTFTTGVISGVYTSYESAWGTSCLLKLHATHALSGTNHINKN